MKVMKAIWFQLSGFSSMNNCDFIDQMLYVITTQVLVFAELLKGGFDSRANFEHHSS